MYTNIYMYIYIYIYICICIHPLVGEGPGAVLGVGPELAPGLGKSTRQVYTVNLHIINTHHIYIYIYIYICVYIYIYIYT